MIQHSEINGINCGSQPVNDTGPGTLISLL